MTEPARAGSTGAGAGKDACPPPCLKSSKFQDDAQAPVITGLALSRFVVPIAQAPSQHDPLNLAERDLVAAPVVELRGGRRGMPGDVLRVFQ